MDGKPGRGRPPKNSTWSPSQQKYTPQKPRGRPPKGMSWNAEQNEYAPSIHGDNGSTSPIIDGSPNYTAPAGASELHALVQEFQMQIDHLDELALILHRRQNPYRECTRKMRDSSGQYREGFFATNVMIETLPNVNTCE